MKHYIYNALAACGCIAALTACDENSWNENELKGFEVPEITDVQNLEYALTEEDYTTISKLLLANAKTKEDTTAARAIASNKYFDKTSVYPATVAVPVLFSQVSSPYYFPSNGSTVDVTYNEASSVPEEIAQLGAAKTYTLTSADYQTVWESEDNFITGFAPSKPAASSLPSILKTALPDAVEGDFAVVTYNEAATNPVFGTVEGNDPQVYINETFAESIGNFTIENVQIPEGSTYVWKFDTFNSQSYMKASGFVSKACRDSEGWLLSPEFTLSDNANATLSFEQAWKNFKTLDNAKAEATVQIRIKGGSWEKLTPSNLPENTSYDFYPTGNIDLSAYNGKTVQIGFCYVSTTASAGTWELRNVLVQDGVTARSRAAVAEVPTVPKNAVYTFNGSKWTVAEGVVILSPADYEAMGMTNNNLNDADIYIPIYLKSQFPYALDGDMKYVMYNGKKVDLFVLAGGTWILNNNGLETVTGRYTKKDGAWSFTKYIGKAIYTAFKEEEIILNRSYLIASGAVCANPVEKNKSYGYLLTTQISVSEDQVVMSNDANAFTFATTASVEGVDYKAPDGYFFIIDSNNRFVYRSGTFGSFNVSEKPSDSMVGYLWTAKPADEGKWIINCDLGNGNTRNVYFSNKYNNFAVYADATTEDVLPQLYILE
ncbi:MAG: choice-of-anchor J domain-containing protein [Paramuribaculum sp.]|nr:choice-of-anchor J domain-containing protein [Paramuribaculum sp.]